MKTSHNLGYYFSEGFRSIFTHGLMSFAAVFMIVACLIIMGSFSLVALNLERELGQLEEDNQFLQDAAVKGQEGEEAKSAQEVMEEAECQTCKNRKYQDGSDDPGVSFKTATNIAPERAAAAVRGHEQEHVVREQAKAQREDRKVVSQSVTLHTAICPECGDVYVSGGTTRTTTKANPQQETDQEENQKSGFQAFA